MKGRLTARDRDRFPSNTLFDRLGRALCDAGCLPRKELFEAWEVARRVRRRFRGGRIVDCAGGHGLLAHAMLLLDDSSPSAVVVDPDVPVSHERVREALTQAWPRLENRVRYARQAVDAFTIEPDDIVVSSHTCGALTDRILDAAANAGARIGVLPCCQDLGTCDPGRLEGWLDGPLAVDVMRAVALERRGYEVWTQTIPAAITPKNRLLLAQPATS